MSYVDGVEYLEEFDGNGDALFGGSIAFYIGDAPAADGGADSSLIGLIDEVTFAHGTSTVAARQAERFIPGQISGIADTYYRFDDSFTAVGASHQGPVGAEDSISPIMPLAQAAVNRGYVAVPQGATIVPVALDDDIDSTFAYLNADTDADGLFDIWEQAELGDLATAGPGTVDGYTDSDQDGLNDLYEMLTGLDPETSNTPAELAGNPDADGLTHLQEQAYGTDPNLADTDDDGTNDGPEVLAGTDPTDSRSPFVLQAMEFGAGDTVTVAVNQAQQKLNLAGMFTIEAWVKPVALANNSTILSKSSGSDVNYELAYDADGDVTFTLGDQTVALGPDARIAVDEWSHIAAVRTNTTTLALVVYTPDARGDYQTYSTQYTSIALESVQPSEDGALTIGSAAFSGRIDEVRVWDTSWSFAAIAAARNGVLNGAEAGLVAYYAFDDGGNTVEDFTARNDWDLDGALGNTDASDPVFVADAAGVTEVDTDADGIDDAWENAYFGPLTVADPNATVLGFTDWDNDGVTDLYEFLAGRNPTLADAENTDSDSDGLTDELEQAAGTHPGDADTDDDGVEDGAEAADGTDPLDSLSPLVNRALTFAAATDAATVAYAPVINGDLSIQAWVNTTDGTALRNVLTHVRGRDGLADYAVQITADEKLQFSYRTEAGTVNTAVMPEPALTVDEWVNVGITIAEDGIDGIVTLVASIPSSGNTYRYQERLSGHVLAESGTLVFGDPDGVGAAVGMVGSVDEARVWSDVRTEVEIAAWSDVPLTGAELTDVNLAGYWRFDDGQYTGGNAHGTPVGAEDMLHRLDSIAALEVNRDFVAVLAGATFSEPTQDSVLGETYTYLSADADADNIMDWWEIVYFGDTATADIGLVDGYTDTDLDGLNDLYEFMLGFDPRTTNTEVDLAADTSDIDNLSNITEQQRGTDPYSNDTDDDGDMDGDELTDGTDPLDSLSPQVLQLLDLNVAGDYVRVPPQDKLELTTLTLEAWVKPDVANATGTIIEKTRENDGAVNYRLSLDGGYAKIEVGTTTLTANVMPVLAGKWAHIAASLDGVTQEVTLSVYTETALGDENMKTVRISSGALPPPTGRGYLTIGAAAGGIIGEVDEVRVWNTVRTSDDVANNRLITFPTAPAGLVAYYRFDDAGTTVEDFTARLSGDAPTVRANLLVAGERIAGAVILADSPGLTDFDSDLDNLPDWWELQYFGDLTTTDGTLDADNEGLTDYYEFLSGNNPLVQDTDGDGSLDVDADDDLDGVPNGVEQTNTTHPNDADTDDDGLNDGEEVASGTDPLDSLSPLVNRVLELANADDYARVAFGPELSGDVSVQVWAMFADGAATRSVVTKVLSEDSQPDFAVQITADENLQFVYRTEQGGTWNTVTMPNPALPTDEWINLAVTLQQDAMDGIVTLIAYVPSSGNLYRYQQRLNGRLFGGEGTLYFGDADGAAGANESIIGSIDEARIWGDVRSDAEIVAVRDVPLSGAELTDLDLAGYWRFDDSQYEGALVHGTPKGAEDFTHPISNLVLLEDNREYVGELFNAAAFRAPAQDRVTGETYTYLEADVDGDNIMDWWEIAYFGDITTADLGTVDGYSDVDADGLNDLYEFLLGFDPRTSNSEADLAADTSDTDNLSNITEQQRGTDPYSADTDDDTLEDGAELTDGTDPLDSLSPQTLRLLELAAATDYVEFPAQAKLELTNLTVEVWVKPTVDSATGVIIEKTRSTDGAVNYSLELDGGYAKVTVGGTSLTASVLPVLADKWAHIAASLNGATQEVTLSVYTETALGDENMKTVRISTGALPPPTGSGVFRIGARSADDLGGLVGQVDEVRVWDTIRTSDQIANNRLITLPTPPAGLVAYYRFDDSGVTVEDFTARLAGDTPTVRQNLQVVGTRTAGATIIGGNPGLTDFDSDLDNQPDWWEMQYFGDLTTSNGTQDFDIDDLTDYYEYLAGTNPLLQDTDGDGTLDADADMDGDEVVNIVEQTNQTHPRDVDTDDDNIDDGTEVAQGTDPLDSLSPLVNRVLGFAADTAYARVALGPEISGDVSVQAWVNTQATGVVRSLVTKILSADSQPDYAIRIDAGEHLQFIYRTEKADRWNTVTMPETIIPAGEWVNVAATLNEDGIDGVVTLTVYRPATGITETYQERLQGRLRGGEGTLYFGDADGAAGALAGLVGALDDVRIWDDVRTPVELAASAAGPLGAADLADANLLGYWRFDDAEYTGALTHGEPKGAEDFTHRTNDVTTLIDNRDYVAERFAATFVAPAQDSALDDTYTYFDADVDNDGIADWWETVYFDGTNLAGLGTVDGHTDADGDGLNDLYEFLIAGFDPRTGNTTADLDADSDVDLLSNILEQRYATNPNAVDSDDDGLYDGEEITGTNNGASTADPAGVQTDALDSRSPYVLRALDLVAGDTVTVNVHASQQKLNLATFTVELWVKPTSLQDGSVMLARGAGVNTNYSLAHDADGNVTLTVGNQTLTSVPAAQIQASEWSHIAAVSDGATLSLTVVKPDPDQAPEANAWVTYTNGAALTHPIPVDDAALVLGSAAFVGRLDEARIWNVARLGVQLVGSRFASLTGNEFGLVAYYPFDDSGITVEDFTARNDWDVAGVRTAGATIQNDIGSTTAVDTDNDGLADSWELGYFGDLAQNGTADSDSDGVSDFYEFLAGTNPTVADAADLDTDSDNLTNADEEALGTHPNNADTDDDESLDGDEVVQGTDPLDSLSPLRNGALELSAATEYAQVAIGPALGTAMTVEAWIKLTDASDDTGVIVEKANVDGGADDFELRLNSGDLEFEYRRADGNTNTIVLDTNITSADGWCHVAAILDPAAGATGTVRLVARYSGLGNSYFWLPNQVETTVEANLSGALDAGAGALRIGSAADGSITGMVDEVRVWSVAQTVAQLRGLRGAPIASLFGLVGYWRFDDLGLSAESFVTGERFNTALASIDNADFAAVAMSGADVIEIPSNVQGDETFDYIAGDLDGDGMPDFWELRQFGSTAAAGGNSDADGDTMTDQYEFLLGWNPLTTNLVVDGTTPTLGLSNDNDSDGLSNIEEQQFGTNPLIGDTDEDGMLDGQEIVGDHDADSVGTPGYITSPLYSMNHVNPLAEMVPARSLDLSKVVGTAGIAVPASRRFDRAGAAWTLEAWVRPEASETGVILSYKVGANTAMQIGLAAGVPYASFNTVGGATVMVGGAAAGIPPFAADEWRHVSASWDPQAHSLRLVLDGLLTFSQMSLEVPVSGIGTLYIGGTDVAGDEMASGLLDEVRVWTVARDQAQVEATRDTILGTGTGNLLAYYRFDDGGVTVEDFAPAPYPVNDAAVWDLEAALYSAEADADGDKSADWVTTADAMVVTGIDDRDFDGLPDGWEAAFVVDIDERFDGLDSDGDGVADDLGGIFATPETNLTNTTDDDGDGFVNDNAANPFGRPEVDLPANIAAGIDYDGDGLSTLGEYLVGTNPYESDSDNNGISDADEDFDGDGLTNAQETVLGTDPVAVDTDDDSKTDDDEVLDGTDPLDELSRLRDRVLELTGATTASVMLPMSGRFALNSWTLEAWVKPTTAGDSVIVSRSVGAVNFALGIDDVGGNLLPYVTFTPSDGTGAVTVTAAVADAIELDEWTHVAASFDPANALLHLVIDGVEEYTLATIKTCATNGVGPVATMIGSSFIGQIDEVRIWDVPLNAAQIAGASDTLLTGNEAGLVSYFRFDDDGTYATDFTQRQDWLNDWANAGMLGVGATMVVAGDDAPVTSEDVDSDGDGIVDLWEYQFIGDLSSDGTTDLDGDGLTDYYEYLAQLDPRLVDTDANGINDADEDLEDSGNGDGLTNAEEQIAGTHPLLLDTDDDGVEDGDELDQGTSPRYAMAHLDPTSSEFTPDRSLDLSVVAAAAAPWAGIVLPEPVRFDTQGGAWTLEAWVRMGTDDTGAILSYQVDGDTAMEIGLNNGIPYTSFDANDGSTYTVGGAAGVSPFVADTWRHVAGVWDAAAMELNLYVDGVLEFTLVTDNPPVSGVGEMTLGGDGTTALDDGLLDEVKVWRLARTLAGVADSRDVVEIGEAVAAGFQPGTYGGVLLPAGELSFADRIVSYRAGTAGQDHTDSSEALGAPDYSPTTSPDSYVALGQRGVLVVEFIDNVLTSGPGDDLYIFEIGQAVEGVTVEISPDGTRWTPVGAITGGTRGIDIDPFLSQTSGNLFRFVRLTDDGTNSYTGSAPGSDIDAVAAINNVNVAYPMAYFRFDDAGLSIEDMAVAGPALTSGDFLLVAADYGVAADADDTALWVPITNAMMIRGIDDVDADGIADWYEDLYGGSTTALFALNDNDGDRLTNLTEFLVLTDPNHADTDSDGITDDDGDFDGDGLSNIAEQLVGSDPTMADTDDDGEDDEAEVLAGTDPVDELSLLTDRV
ncbi:MAG: hypothetical protein HON70_18745, partial [Lentisphaerae bacterium]|nr:hypothetical protein [Lentisphaerota bacterium]